LVRGLSTCTGAQDVVPTSSAHNARVRESADLKAFRIITLQRLILRWRCHLIRSAGLESIAASAA